METSNKSLIKNQDNRNLFVTLYKHAYSNLTHVSMDITRNIRDARGTGKRETALINSMVGMMSIHLSLLLVE